LNKKEMGEIFEHNWLEEKELMNEEYLKYVIIEKQYGKVLADSALRLILKSKSIIKNEADYNSVYGCFYRTKLTADLRVAAAKAYYGYRVFSRGEKFQTDFVKNTLNEGLREMDQAAEKIRNYSKSYPVGQWN